MKIKIGYTQVSLGIAFFAFITDEAALRTEEAKIKFSSDLFAMMRSVNEMEDKACR